MALLLVIIVLAALSPAHSQPAWLVFLYGGPIMLLVLVAAGLRWALMACVIYATINLALDLATIVQELTAPVARLKFSLFFGISGIVNVLLVIVAGSCFMHGTWTPRAARLPNRPHPPASGPGEHG